MKIPAALLLTLPLALPAISLAQQVAIGEYAMPDSISYVTDMIPGPDGAVWFIDGGDIGRITPAGKITLFSTNTGWDVGGFTTGPDDAIWFIEANGRKIGRMTAAGAVTQFPLPNPNSEPQYIAAGSDGALWFTDFGTNEIGRMTTAGVVTEFPVPSPGAGLASIARGPDGAVWFLEADANNIGRITPAGVVTEYPVPTVNSGMFCCIAAGPDGAVWFTEYLADNIGRITTDGLITEYPVTYNSGPQGITAGPDGAVWFTESRMGTIGRITTSGTVTTYLVPQPNGVNYIAQGPDGELWFSAITGYGGVYTPGMIGEVVLVTANLSVTPAQGYYHENLDFAGSGFAPNESVQIYSSGVGSKVLATVTADGGGSFTASAVAPEWFYAYGNPRLFLGKGQTSGMLGAASFTMEPHLMVTPNSGAAGSTATATGFGYGPFETVRLFWDNPRTYLGTAYANVYGTFNGSAALQFTVPSGATPGANGVIGRGYYTYATGTGPFTVE